MIHYILQIIAFQLLFLVVYDLFLKKELYFNWNRVYLILTPILSFVLPLIKIDFIRNNIPSEYVVQLPAVILGRISGNEMATVILDEVTVFGASVLSTGMIIQLIWLTGMLVSFSFFIFKLYKIYQLKRTGTKTKINKTTIVSLPETDASFSFLNTIFLGESLSAEQKETILLHEKAHIEEKHSFDLLFFEAIKIICWFNPLVYVFQNKMTLLQEYIADEKAASVKGKKAYYNKLLSQMFQTESISFINTFFNHSLIKKRIIMLQKSTPNARDYKIRQLKYLLLIPIIGVMLTYTSCVKEPETVQTNSVSEKISELKIALENEQLSEKDKKELLTLIFGSGDSFVEKREIEDYEKGSVIPFATIDRVPIYPDCTGTTNEELKRCMSEKIMKLVQKEFNTELAADLGLEGKQRISVQFKIDELGNIVGVRARAPHKSLEKEALRVVSKLPKMKPGEQDGKPVAVLYSLPILFKVEE
ncbi:MAG: M56 family metallopeptidase [Flavobacteriaceae bacterium]|nr:M56 family metallopeptidase [Flavobacteriaceae bacterium]